MLHRFGVVLAAATLTVAGWVGTDHPAGAVSPASTPPPACPPALPISGMVTATTATTLTVSYTMLLSPPCGYDPPIAVTLFASRADAEQRQNPVARGVSGPERYGQVTVGGLTPDTEYWFRFSDAEGRWDPYVIGGPGRTTPQAVCAATAVIDAGWGGGFVATVTVRNSGDEPLDGWRVSWRWPGDERVQSVWGGTVEDPGPDVVVRNAPYNGTLSPGGSTTFGLLVATSGTPGLAPTCDR
jgi:cellulase/cellobiase CelA1